MTLHYNHPARPAELQILDILKQRMKFVQKSQERYHHLQKGYEGEDEFSKLLKKHLNSDCIVLYDLLLDHGGSEFQIDCLIIQQRDIWHFEIKNFTGDFRLKDEKLFSLATGIEVRNPLVQLERSQFLLRRTLEKLTRHFTLHSKVVFVNPEFTLYESPLNSPIVHPTQLHRFINNLNKTPSTLSKSHIQLATKLFSGHISGDAYKRLPEYKYNRLRKGIHCMRCHEVLVAEDALGKRFICKKCCCREGRDSLIVRSANQFNLLFPESNITTVAIHDWCDGNISKYKIREILLRYLHPVGVKKHKHYVFMDRDR